MRYTLGLDFGTESARAVLVNVITGETVATAVEPYPDGVIDEILPRSDVTLPPDWALQNASDWLATLEKIIARVLAKSGVSGKAVIGLGVDFTACTILPTTADGTPLHTLDSFCQQPHAWVKLWKHHSAQPHADRVNQLAAARKEPWLKRYGGKISSEWFIPKALQLLEEAPDIYGTATRIVEGGDWVVWQLTGQLVRNACAAGYKGTWHKVDGYPSTEFLAALNPGLANLYTEKAPEPVVPPGLRAGTLLAGWAERLGLTPGIPVAVAIIDGHAAVSGGGVTGPGTLFMIMGTSNCHMLMAKQEMVVEGIAGVVEDGIAPGLFGYEAGQSGAGDIFAWFLEHGIPPVYHEEAAGKGVSLHDVLTEKAALQHPGQHGLLALDWWNGNRSTLMDADLSGVLIGASLGTRAEDIYRALIEATAFGTRIIIETFIEQGVPVDAIVAAGGLSKNNFLMQLYADVMGSEIALAGSDQATALGAAMLGAVAAGTAGGGYATLAGAAEHMAPPPVQVYRPTPENVEPYEILYHEYRRLYDYLGRGDNNVMKVLREMRRG